MATKIKHGRLLATKSWMLLGALYGLDFVRWDDMQVVKPWFPLQKQNQMKAKLS